MRSHRSPLQSLRRVLQHAPEGTFLLREAAAEDTDLTPCGENMDLVAMLSVRGPSADDVEHVGLVELRLYSEVPEGVRKLHERHVSGGFARRRRLCPSHKALGGPER